MRARKRRTPDEARLEILEAAEARLRAHGIDGLNVVDVAKACGMSHATLLHHFGSTGGMRKALVAHMTARLLADIITTLENQPELEPPEMLQRLFDTLNTGGHTKLLAWLSVSADALAEGTPAGTLLQDHFAALVPVIASRLPEGERSEAQARRIVFLIAAAAIGTGVGGPMLPGVIGMSEAEVESFPAWLGGQIYHLVCDDC
ncbi:MAG: TetR/AcrR family transcriptional regulator [Pseudomonadales bacterium]